jgi:hypothetical protein
VALWLVSRKEQVAPRAGFVAASRRRVVSRIQEEARNSGAKRSIFGFVWPQKIAYQWVAALLALVIFFSGTGGLVTFAQGALPGDSLYSVKQASETVAMAVTVNEVKKVELSASFTERRADEVALLITRGSVDQVDNALQAFEKQVSQTVTMLQDVDNAGAHEKKVLAVAVRDHLTEQAGKLNELQAIASDELRGQLETASNLTILGATLAGEEAEKIFDPTETPTVTPTITPSASPSPSPVPTDTPVPVPSETEIVGEKIEDPSLVPDPSDPTRKVTKTPRPTNDNRPTKQPDPGGGKPEDKPGKPDKPDKSKNN